MALSRCMWLMMSFLFLISSDSKRSKERCYRQEVATEECVVALCLLGAVTLELVRDEGAYSEEASAETVTCIREVKPKNQERL